MIGILFIAITIFLSAVAQADANKSITCINDLIKWCENKDYENIGQENILSSTSVNGSYQAISCTSNSSGTKCSKNNSPWFACSPDHKVTYKGVTLHKNSGRGVDDEICDASRTVNSNGSGISTNARAANEKMFKDCFPFCD